MNLRKLIFTNNACYKAGRKITVKGIMVHSTGANNPWLKRYVGPDDGLLGKNKYNNHWNRAMDRQVCVHGFIGKLADGTIATYQTLPWNMRGWHGASGKKGSVNNTHIGFEICEDGLTDPIYFNKVYQEAVELCVYLCKMFNLTEKDIICHCEGYKMGIASNHSDVMHWFPKHGKSMDTFRADVKVLLNRSAETPPSIVTPEKPATDGLYRVQVGAYSKLDNARNQLAAVQGKGFEALVKKIGNLYKVQTGAYSVKGNAEAQLARVKAAGFKDAHITKESGGTVVATTPDEVEPAYVFYTVKKGDTLWEIAKKFLGKGRRYTEIKTMNGLTSDTVHTGQVLKIPDTED